MGEQVPDLFARLMAGRRAALPEEAPEPAPVQAVVVFEDPVEVARDERARIQDDAKTARAQAALEHSHMLIAGRRAAVVALETAFKLLSDEDWLKEQGAVGIAAIVKLMEAVNKETRLNNGQATENIAHAVSVLDPERLRAMTGEQRQVLRAGLLRGLEAKT